MIGFGFWDSSNNACVNDNVLNLLDFPMESLESDGLDEDLDAKFRRLGPSTWEALQRLSSTPTHNVRNGSWDLQSNSTAPSEQICQLNQKPEFFEETSSINNSHKSSISKEQLVPLEPRSPISALSSSGSSCSGEKNSPITLISPPINNSGLRKSQRKKKKLSQLYAVKQRPSKQQPTSTRRCTHCEITRTPQWRDGPKGPKSLCNACGVRYRSGRLLPEYRPAASPTFVPSLHSNNHRKVVEIRSGTVETAIVKESEGVRTPKSEKI